MNPRLRRILIPAIVMGIATGIVAVGIFGQPPEVDLFRFFWRELQLFGARVYEHEDFARAIELAAAGAIPLDKIISDIHPLTGLKAAGREAQEAILAIPDRLRRAAEYIERRTRSKTFSFELVWRRTFDMDG